MTYLLAILSITALSLSAAAGSFQERLADSMAQKTLVPSGDLTSEDVERFIPTAIPSGSSQSLVTEKIVFHSVDNIVKKLSQKKTARRYMNLAQSVSLGVQLDTGFQIKGDEPNSISHKFSFQAKLAQSVAQLNYAGLIDASFTYSLKAQSMKMELNQKLDSLASLSLSQQMQDGETQTHMNLTLSY